MKKLLFIFLLGAIVFSCKKEASISENNNLASDSVQIPDSLSIQSADNPNAFRVETIADKADLGKVIFTENGKTIISFDTQSNTGKIKLNGKEYPLNNLNFSENTYEISGSEIEITAEDGNFQEMVSDCNYGTFPEFKIKFNNQEVKLANIKVQDCPNYN